MDIVRVIKVYIFEGEREWVEKTLDSSIEGIMTPDKRKPHNRIMGATMGKFPEILKEFERPSGGE